LQGLEPLSGYVQDYSLQLAAREEAHHGAFRRHLRRSGVPVEASKGEAGPGQHELNVRYADALTMADRTQVYKQCIKEVADQQGIAVTFMAKPVATEAGSSCHIHISLWHKDGSSAFYSPDAPLWHGLHATQDFQWFLGGLLRHAGDVLPWLAPTVNSYRRYNTGQWAPTRLAWTPDNRTTAFRVVGDGPALRIEARIPGADANPYLALAALIGCGLEGIRTREDPGPPFTGNAYAAQQLPRIARSLALATAQMDGSQMARRVFGDGVVEHYVHFYDNEDEAFQRAVTDWELKRYFERI
jgi:glutamine synthetase